MREKVLGLLLALEREVGELDGRAASLVRIYRERIEEILAAEAVSELWSHR